jgi:hypothetical protein
MIIVLINLNGSYFIYSVFKFDWYFSIISINQQKIEVQKNIHNNMKFE